MCGKKFCLDEMPNVRLCKHTIFFAEVKEKIEKVDFY